MSTSATSVGGAPSGEASATGEQRLERNVLSVPNGIALAAAAMAPVIAVVLNAPAAAPSAGSAVPLAFLLAFIATLFVGNTVIQFARHMPSAGSFYTFNSQGLGTTAGFATGWLYWMGYALLVPGLMTAFGSFASAALKAEFGVDVKWWVLSLAALAIVLGLSIRSIKASVQLDLALLVGEVIIFTILLVIAIVTSHGGNSIELYNPSSRGGGGISGVGLGMVFGILSFLGFDAAATLGEETRNPRRNVPLAVAGALIGVGVFYVFATYGLSAGYGIADPAKLAAFAKDSSPISTLAQDKASWIAGLVDIAGSVGIFSCFLACHNATVRIVFSLGRDRVLPGWVGDVHQRYFSPAKAILLQTAFTAAIGFGLAAWIGPGATGAYGFSGALATVATILVWILGSVALMRYYWRRPDRNLLTHGLVPVLAALVLIYPIYTVAKPGQAWPYNLVPYLVLAWIVLGALVWAALRARHPERIASLGAVFEEEADELMAEGGATGARTPSLESVAHPGSQSGRAPTPRG